MRILNVKMQATKINSFLLFKMHYSTVEAYAPVRKSGFMVFFPLLTRYALMESRAPSSGQLPRVLFSCFFSLLFYFVYF